MRAGRTTSIASVISLLAAFVTTALVMGLLVAGVAIPAVGVVGTATRSGIDVFDSLPDSFTAAPLSQQSRILAADGSTLATIYDQNRIIVGLASVAPIMRKAQVAIEDSRFYEHGGLDVRGVVRAVVSNAQGDVVQGGSTLTQQYVKLLLQNTALANGDTAAAAAAASRSGIVGVTRKLQELKYSIQLEKTLTKDQILQGYFNISYYGDQTYGIEAAARHYFSVPASKLNLPQAALLAGLTQNPGTTDPINFPAKALARRNVVLDRMLTLKIISKAAHDAAKKVTLAQMLRVQPAVNSCAAAGTNAYFCQYALNYVLQDASFDSTLGPAGDSRRAKIYGGGYTITTTLEPAFSSIARNAIIDRVPEGNSYEIGSAAVSIDPRSGAVRSTAQNTSYPTKVTASSPWNETQINYAVDKKYGGSNGFGFGSTAKAFALVTALGQGLPINTTVNAVEASAAHRHSYTSADFPGGSANCGIDPGYPWSTKNESANEGGVQSLTKATAKSVNTAFIALTQKVGACNVHDTEVKMGLHLANGGEWPKNPASIILGTAEISPMTVASAYGIIANGGKWCTADPISAIADRTGKALAIPKLGQDNCKQVIDADVAAGVAEIMKAPLEASQGGTAAASALAGGRIAAGKTGTTDGNQQTWFVGYTPTLVTAVWTGTPITQHVLDNITMGNYPTYPVVYGAAISAPIWKKIMDAVLADTPNQDFPAPSDKIVNGNVQSFRAVGYSVADATASLQAQGYQVQVGNYVYSGYRPGVVASTDPGYKAPVGTTIVLHPSAGPNPNAQQNPPNNPLQPGQGNGPAAAGAAGAAGAIP